MHADLLANRNMGEFEREKRACGELGWCDKDTQGIAKSHGLSFHRMK